MLDINEYKKRRILAVALVGLLAVTLFSVNLINIGQQTVLSESHVIETFDDENVYADVTEALRDDLTESISPTEREADELAETGFPENYTKNEINRNVENIYLFLDGERDSVHIWLNYTTVRQRLSSAETTAETQQEINETLPDRIVIEENLDEGSLGLVRPVVDNTQNLFLGSVGLLVVLVGVILYWSRSYEQTAKRVGFAIAAAGVLSVLVSVVLFILLSATSAPPPAENEIDPELVYTGIFSAFESAIVSLLTQSLALVAFGVVLVWIGRDEPVRPPVPLDAEGVDEEDTEETGGDAPEESNPEDRDASETDER